MNDIVKEILLDIGEQIPDTVLIERTCIFIKADLEIRQGECFLIPERIISFDKMLEE